MFDKFEKIFQYLIKDIPSPISYYIPYYVQCNERILYLLFGKGLLKPDETFLHNYNQIYLYPKLKEYIDKKRQKLIEKQIFKKFGVDILTFEEKCQIGENDSYVCSLIRSDSVEEFIIYVNRTNLSLNTKIDLSIYETNSFLIGKKPTLIEYAAFFGSIQIIQYLKYNKVPLTFSLWLYAIHSNNAELIHFLEENEVKPIKSKKYTFDNVLCESIRCHHNDIANYIKDNFHEQIKTGYHCSHFCDNITYSLNFFFFPNDFKSIICKSNNLVKFSLKNLCSSLTQITIPSSVTSIGNYAFSECSSLTQIAIPSSVTSIGDSAFSKCSSLTQITIPSSVTSIGGFAFRDCSSLTQITIPSSVTSIGEFAFEGCSSLTLILIPSSVTSIGNRAFDGCSSLTQITIPSSVTSFEKFIFNKCSSLTQIAIPSSVTSFGFGVFFKCEKLEKIAILPCEEKRIKYFEDKFLISKSESSNNNYETLVWAKPSLKKVTIPPFIKAIGFFAFSNYSSLTQIIIPSSVTSIGNCAFSECSSLAKVAITFSLTSIGHCSFSECSSLTQVTINSPITSIVNYVFSNYSLLTQAAILSSETSIGDYAFYGCSSLTQITISPSVTSIGDSAFYRCSSLTQITIPPSVTSIGNYSFNGCSSLKQITFEIPSSVTSIGEYAFSNCSSLQQITIPPSVTSIGGSAFFGCPSLHIAVPSSFDTSQIHIYPRRIIKYENSDQNFNQNCNIS